MIFSILAELKTIGKFSQKKLSEQVSQIWYHSFIQESRFTK